MRTENMLAFTPFNIFLEAGESLQLPGTGLRGPAPATAALPCQYLNKYTYKTQLLGNCCMYPNV